MGEAADSGAIAMHQTSRRSAGIVEMKLISQVCLHQYKALGECGAITKYGVPDRGQRILPTRRTKAGAIFRGRKYLWNGINTINSM